jgi:hypothetical protein
LICRAAFRGMAKINFLASGIYSVGFKQPDWRHSSRPILSFRQWADVPRRIRDWPQGILMCLIVRIGRGDLATGYRCPHGWLRPLSYLRFGSTVATCCDVASSIVRSMRYGVVPSPSDFRQATKFCQAVRSSQLRRRHT